MGAIGIARALRVGTRGSALALTQTRAAVAMLQERTPHLGVEEVVITTTGDVRQDVPLSALGGQGAFVTEIERALRESEVDLAVHSAKDLPSQVPEGLRLAAFTEREDPRDVLVSPFGTIDALPEGARVGTSSQRRACQLRARRPDLTLLELRGNVDTRLRKLDEGGYDAIVLAGAGLRRLGLQHRATEWIPVDVMLPMVSQGAIALETRANDPWAIAIARTLAHPPTETAVRAERGFLARLGAGCSAAVAAHATIAGDTLTLQAMIGAPDGRLVRGTREGAAADAEAIGASLAEWLVANGGAEFTGAFPEAHPFPT